MLRKLINKPYKKINKARVVYDTYCKLNNLEKTREATGLAINTIRTYIALIEDIDSKSKLSSKDRYYNNNIYKDNNIYPISNNNNDGSTSSIPDNIDIYNNIYNNKEDINNNIGNIDNNNDINDIEVITTNNVPSLKETKNKILLGKLDSISVKYLDYLDEPDKERLDKTSLKDRAVIAGILLDKKILLEHKQADVIKNQSIIFNLFGNNKNLASFISGSLGRQKALKDRPVKKYILATNK